MKIYLVGGAVRDQLLGLKIKERDYVVVGATVAEMLALGYKQVGKDFPVFLHPKTHEEYALARMERKVKPGYSGFTFDTSPNVTLEDDLIRRDLTINAMAQTAEGKLIDPYHGADDIKAKCLRHVSQAFVEDPVRILRVGRFYARYAHLGFHVAAETMQLMREMVASGEVNALVAERVWKELERALSEKNPEKFFTVLEACQALPILFPDLAPDGFGIKALTQSVTFTQETQIRFAVLFHDVPDAKKTLRELMQRYRLPKAYASLAKLTALHYPSLLQAQQLTPQPLVLLFSEIDIYRRPGRFQQLLLACEIIAQTHQQTFDAEWLLACARALKSINIQALVDQGLTGNELAAAIQAERIKAAIRFKSSS